MNLREPLLKPVAVDELRPTQITIGFHEVAEKRKKFAEQKTKSGDEFLGHHVIPVVVGPKGRRYVIDNHHLARALHEDGVKEVLVRVVADVESLSKASLWTFLDNKNWCHPYDGDGKRVDFDDIPVSIDKLVDDPYRSLAGDLRHAGGFAKDITPFSEFLWADFLRRRITPKALKKDYDKSLKKAVDLAKGKDAGYLPGWCGPDPIG